MEKGSYIPWDVFSEGGGGTGIRAPAMMKMQGDTKPRLTLMPEGRGRQSTHEDAKGKERY